MTKHQEFYMIKGLIAESPKPIVYLHTYRYIQFQFLGWAIVLNEDGTWDWEDTSGG